MKKLTGGLIAGYLIFLVCSDSKPVNGQSHFENRYVSIDFDTVYVDCGSNSGTMILIDSTYYIFSKRIIDLPNFRDYTDKFYGFSRNGEKLFETAVPELFNSYYYLQPQNDTLIAIIGNSGRTLYFDRAGLNWLPTERIKPCLFEDEDYYVTYTCSGEWGGTIYFRDKHTGITYEGSSTCPVKVSKHNGKYYVSNYLGHIIGHSTLYEIANPREMNPCEGERPRNGNIDRRECRSTEGMKKLADILGYFGTPEYDPVLKDSVSRSRSVELLSSFVRNDQLLHLYSDAEEVFIGKLEGGDSVISHVKDPGIEHIYRFKTPMTNNPWVKFSRADYQQLHLLTDQNNVNVIMEITPVRILVHYIINKNR